eukprot:tig00000404_g377.t1
MAKVQASNAMPDVLCYFCYDRLREPRILDCCHSFCTSCLSRAAKDGAVSCPTCTLSTTVPPTGITALPRNYILEELIEQAVPPDCDNCRTNPPAQAQLYCHQCTANFCHQCGMAVHAEKLFRSHQLVSISEKPSSRGADQMCLIHKTERLKLYCETCETVICSDCVFSPQHHEHITTYTLDAHESAKRELTALLKRSQLIAASLSSDMKLLDHNVQTSVGEHERISKLVNDAFDKVVASLNRRRNELLDVLDVALERRLIRLDSVRKTTQKFRGNVDDANLIASRTIERGDPIETLALKNRFARRVADFEGTDVSGRSRDPFEFAVQLQDVEAAAAASRRLGFVRWKPTGMMVPPPMAGDPEYSRPGVIHWLGTNRGKAKWQNPAVYKIVNVAASSVYVGMVEMFVDNKVGRFCTQDEPNAWVSVALPKTVLVYVTHYTLGFCQGGDRAVPRNWDLQGSRNGRDWVTLSSHRNDKTFSSKLISSTWRVEERDEAFSQFRVLQTGPSGQGNFLCVSGFEVYGMVLDDEIPSLMGTATAK